MTIKFGIGQKTMGSPAPLDYATVASGFLSVFTLDSPEIREMKRREKVRCELVKSQFGIGIHEGDVPLIDRFAKLLKLD